jgi:hypothetical protein
MLPAIRLFVRDNCNKDDSIPISVGILLRELFSRFNTCKDDNIPISVGMDFIMLLLDRSRYVMEDKSPSSVGRVPPKLKLCFDKSIVVTLRLESQTTPTQEVFEGALQTTGGED